jgi:ubiquinone/menaquinone biosynthesis C-methylase UbiE
MPIEIKKIRSFWNEHPLLAGEIDALVGSDEWFKKFDVIKIDDILLKDIDTWVDKNLAGKRVLDVGCGPGFWARQFSRIGAEYVGIDISDQSVKIARQGQTLYGLKGSFLVGNAEHLPFRDGVFDHVNCEGVIHHTTHTDQCVSEFFRVLKSGGGSGCVSVYYRNVLLRNPALFKAILLLMQRFRIGLKGHNHEKMVRTDDPNEFVRMYDGADNPTGKCYTRGEVVRMFGSFKLLAVERYYFPQRAMPIRLPKWMHFFLSKRTGLMIMVRFCKP